MHRRRFLQQSAAAALAIVARPGSGMAGASDVAAKKPNVVFILTDEWRAQALGYAGDSNAHTPVLDRLASQSVNFTQTISPLPLCCPYRASLITGQYPLTHGVYINDVPLQPKSTTLGEAFKQAGYQTGYIGKWHLYGSPDGHYGRRAAFIPPDKHFGFDYWKAAECDHDYNHSHYFEGDDPTRKFWPGYDAIAQTQDACRYINQNAHQAEPFFLVLSMAPPHFPYGTAPESYRVQFRNRALELRPNVPAAKRERAIEDLRGYYAHCAALDDCVGEVLKTLDDCGLSEDTIIVFTSDHGDMLQSQGLAGKLFPWEESLRVPFLLRYPRKLGSKGRKLEAPLNAPDIMPTLLGLCRIPQPRGLDGMDYSRLILGFGNAGLPDSAFIANPVSTFQLRQCGFDAYRGVRTSRYTYIRSIHGPWLLYDNVQDPGQMHSLLTNKTAEVERVTEEMEHRLGYWLKRQHDQFLPGDEYLHHDGLENYFETKTPLGAYRSPWGDWGPTML